MRSIPLYLQILLGMCVGALLGLLLGRDASPLGELGKLIIQFIKVMSVPLLFLAVVDAFIRTEIDAKSGLRMLTLCAINGVIALVIGLGISNGLQPGKVLSEVIFDLNKTQGAASSAAQSITAYGGQKIDWLKALSGYIPTSITQPFNENAVISVILLAVLSGIALRMTKNHSKVESAQFESLASVVHVLLLTTERILGWLVKLVPIAVFGVVAKTVGEHGFAPLKGLLVYVGVALLGLSIQVGIVYQIWIGVFSHIKLSHFWKHAKEAVIYALGSSSSLATLPVTLKSLEKMGVSMRSSRLAACVGTNLNNDGILLYEAMAVLFVAQVYGIELSFSQQLLAALSCVVAGIGIAGIPEAGLISLALVLTTVGLPVEILPLLLTVDWILSRARATTNVISDMMVAVMLDKKVRKQSAKTT